MNDLSPDGFTGAIVAVEGIRDAAVLLNGPTGCKFYHGAISDGQFPRENSMDPLQFSDEFYFGQPRVPATYLDDRDYVFGATAKLEKILPKVAEKGHRLVAVVNSPGAALIGDDLERFIAGAGLPVPCLAVESTGFSAGFAIGFQESVIRVLERIAPPPMPAEARRVNLVGLSIFHRHWEGDVAELRRLLGLCGIRVNAVFSAGCSVAEMENLGAAAAHLIVHPEYADALGPFLESRSDRPAVLPGPGAPVGFAESERWIAAACEAVGADPAPALADIRAARTRAHDALGRFNSLTGLPKGATFALHADGSLALPLTRWLHEYLGMVPVAVSAGEATAGQRTGIREFLQSIGGAAAWNADPGNVIPDLVLGGEDFIGQFLARELPVVGIDVALPGSGIIDILPKCQLGPTGTLHLLERILNGMMTAE
ncbi:MAG: nitrogenase component 1 [Desulfococcaceae bacterium]